MPPKRKPTTNKKGKAPKRVAPPPLPHPRRAAKRSQAERRYLDGDMRPTWRLRDTWTTRKSTPRRIPTQEPQASNATDRRLSSSLTGAKIPNLTPTTQAGNSTVEVQDTQLSLLKAVNKLIQTVAHQSAILELLKDNQMAMMSKLSGTREQLTNPNLLQIDPQAGSYPVRLLPTQTMGYRPAAVPLAQPGGHGRETTLQGMQSYCFPAVGPLGGGNIK